MQPESGRYNQSLLSQKHKKKKPTPEFRTTAETNEDGIATFKDVPVGQYTIKAHGNTEFYESTK